MGQQLTASQIMTKKLTTLRADTDVYEAIDSLLKNRISGAPVVGAGGELLGMLSELDCIHRLVQAAYDNAPTGTVQAFMSTEVKTIGPDTDLLTIAHIFLDERFRRLPVVSDQGKLLGQISRRDLLSAFNELGRGDSRHEATVLYLSALTSAEDKPITT